MKAFLKSVVARLLAVLLTVSAAFAQDRPAFRQEELEQMLAPIALYPDPLLSQILMAATYPLEVVQAARWSRSNPHLKGEDAVRAVAPMDWDPSVKSLVAFPQILHRMDEKLDWTQRLGEAFLAQEPHVMDAIQGLRQRAAAAGTLRSNEQMRVARQDEHIIIEPAQPQVVYIPYYDPVVAYGPWWWPAYPPVYWGPPAGYYVGPGYWPGFFWGSGIVISTGFFFGHVNWHHRHVTVSHKHVHVTHHTAGFGKPHTIVTSKTDPVAWKHDPVHRRGVPFRHAAPRHEFRHSGTPSGDARRDHRRADAAPGRSPTQQGQDRPADGRGRGSLDSDGPGSRSANPAAPNFQRRSDSGRDNASSPGRGFASQPAPMSPAAQQDRRGDSRGNNVLNFQGRAPTSQPTPAAPTARQEGRPLPGGNNVHRFQGRSPTPQPVPEAPAVRQSQRPIAAVPQGNGREAASQERFRPPAASTHGDRGQSGRQVMTPRVMSPPAPQSRGGGNAAPRMGNGNSRGNGNGAAGGRSVGSFR